MKYCNIYGAQARHYRDFGQTPFHIHAAILQLLSFVMSAVACKLAHRCIKAATPDTMGVAQTIAGIKGVSFELFFLSIIFAISLPISLFSPAGVFPCVRPLFAPLSKYRRFESIFIKIHVVSVSTSQTSSVSQAFCAS
jgi:hypothetical protein